MIAALPESPPAVLESLLDGETQVVRMHGCMYYQPFRDLLPPLTPEEREELREDIREVGRVEVPISAVELEPFPDGIRRRLVVDGNNRTELAAEVGLPEDAFPVSFVAPADAMAARRRAAYLNLRRRQLTQAQKHEVILKLREEGMPAADVAEVVGVDKRTVQRVEAANRSPEAVAAAEQAAREAEQALAERRRRVAELLKQKLSVRKIAAELGVPPTTVQEDKQWLASQEEAPKWQHPEPPFARRMAAAPDADSGRDVWSDVRNAFGDLGAALGIPESNLRAAGVIHCPENGSLRRDFLKYAKAAGDSKGWMKALIDDTLACQEPWRSLLELEAEERYRRDKEADKVEQQVVELGLAGATVAEIVEQLADDLRPGGRGGLQCDPVWWVEGTLSRAPGTVQEANRLKRALVESCERAFDRRRSALIETLVKSHSLSKRRKVVVGWWDELVAAGAVVERDGVFFANWQVAEELGLGPAPQCRGPWRIDGSESTPTDGDPVEADDSVEVHSSQRQVADLVEEGRAAELTAREMLWSGCTVEEVAAAVARSVEWVRALETPEEPETQLEPVDFPPSIRLACDVVARDVLSGERRGGTAFLQTAPGGVKLVAEGLRTLATWALDMADALDALKGQRPAAEPPAPEQGDDSTEPCSARELLEAYLPGGWREYRELLLAVWANGEGGDPPCDIAEQLGIRYQWKQGLHYAMMIESQTLEKLQIIERDGDGVMQVFPDRLQAYLADHNLDPGEPLGEDAPAPVQPWPPEEESLAAEAPPSPVSDSLRARSDEARVWKAKMLELVAARLASSKMIGAVAAEFKLLRAEVESAWAGMQTDKLVEKVSGRWQLTAKGRKRLAESKS